ncbi:MAG TPA: hypothetical protein VM509_00760 [Planctomycetota bacterium]|nr:hypothetical protein [Planctomycetota bacterium]
MIQRNPEPLPAERSHSATLPRNELVAGTRVTTFDREATDLVQRALRWLEHGPDADADVLKPARVWRSGPYGVKLFARPEKLFSALRPSPARRSADLHFALAPVRSPRPVLVLERPSGESLLVYEFVDGEFLDTLWKSGGPGVAAFPDFFADMHKRRVFHGDLHFRNFIWDGAAWTLLDLDGVRPPLHALRGKALAFDQWGRVHFELRGASGLRSCFEAYLAAAGRRWNADWAWARVVVTSARIARQRGLDASYAWNGGADGTRITLAQQRVLGLVSWLS